MNNIEKIIHLITQPHTAMMLDLIRIRTEDDSVETLKDLLGIARSAADKSFSFLTKGDPLLVDRGERGLKVIGSVGVFLGISIGSKFVRVVLLDMNFIPVHIGNIIDKDVRDELGFILGKYDRDESDIRFNEPGIDGEKVVSIAFQIDEKENKLEVICCAVRKIVSCFLNASEPIGGLNLLGIGLAVTGPVNYDHAVWQSSPRIKNLYNVAIADLVGCENERCIRDRGIFLNLDNNAKCAAISEFEFLAEKSKGRFNSDLAVIYIGSGAGASFVLNGTLLRGSWNTTGEIGFIDLTYKNKNGKIKEGKLESLVNGGEPVDELLPPTLNILSPILGVNHFVLVGHSVKVTQKMLDSLMDQRLKFTVPYTNVPCSVERGRGVPYTAAIGAAIGAYKTMCAYDGEKESDSRINLAKEISWLVSR